MPETMRAAILERSHAPLVVDDVQLPDSLTYGQVRVRLEMAAICGSQLGEIAAQKGPDPWLPHLLGHEGTGHVEAVGDGVTRVSVGDRVVLHWRPAPGLQGPSPVYRWRDATLNAGPVTTFNQLAVVAETRVTPLPSHVPAETGCLLGCALTTGIGVVTRDANLLPGESLVVLGAGSVGQCVVQGAKLVAGTPIVAVDVHANKLALAEQHGAHHTVVADEDWEERVRTFVGSSGADVVVETTGVPDVIEAATRLTSARGRTVLVGVPPSETPPRIATLPYHFDKRLVGSHGGGTRPEIPRYVKLIDEGRLNPDKLVDARYPLDAINDALDSLRQGGCTKAIVRMPEPGA